MNLILRTILLLTVCVVINTCSDEAIENPTVFSIESSLYETSSWAEGGLIHQNYRGTAKYLSVNNAYLTATENEGSYLLYLNFVADSLEIKIVKRTMDLNYHFLPDSSLTSNEIELIKHNGTDLALSSAALSLQPVLGENTLTAVINIQSENLGDFNGTVENIPLIGN